MRSEATDNYSFPTRRSSDLRTTSPAGPGRVVREGGDRDPEGFALRVSIPADRKSTRLNSSHVKISYADFCMKKILAEAVGSIAHVAKVEFAANTQKQQAATA